MGNNKKENLKSSNRNLKKSNKIIVAMFIVFVLSMNIVTGFTADKSFSEFENRMLSQAPSFSMKKLMSGKFTKEFEEYVTDQFALRNTWVGIKSDLERMSFKTINNGIYFGDDGYLLEDYKKTDDQLNDNIDSINDFISRLPDMATHLFLIPNSIKVYEDKLPPFASPDDQLDTINKVEDGLDEDTDFLNIYDTLVSKKDEYIYYKTDHHWTSLGAYYAYAAYAEQLGFKPYDKSYFDITKVSDDFYGTFYSKANNKHIKPDYIEIFDPKFDTEYEVSYLDNGKSSESLYEFSYLDKKDKYSMFLDGNHALTKITTNVKNDKKLVIFKDSYAHSFIPFLANHFEEIHVIDLRYYKLNVYNYIEENDISEAIFLYNVKTFSEDSSIELLKI